MVNVDFANPSLILGTALIGCGVLLLNLRNFQNKISRDADIVVAAMVSIVGSTLIFQGWRLDPLLLLCQALTTSVAFWYGLETFRLRSKEADTANPAQLPPGLGPDSSMDAAQQAAAMQQFFQQQQQAGFGPPGAAPPYLPPGSEPYYPWESNTADAASSSGRGTGAPGQALYGAANPYAETIQYDYYGNPIMPPEAAVYGGSAGYGQGYPGGQPFDGPGDLYEAQPEPGTSYTYAPGYGAGTAAGGQAGYDMRPPSPATAGSLQYGGSGFDPSYAARPDGMSSPPPSAQRPGSPSALPPPSAAGPGPYSLPSAPSTATYGSLGPTDGASRGGGSAGSYGGDYAATSRASRGPTGGSELGYGSGGAYGTGLYNGGAEPAWDGAPPPPPAATAPPSGRPGSGGVGGSGAAKAGRVDMLSEEVDDWE